VHPDLVPEQAYLDRAHDALEQMRARVSTLVAALHEGASSDFNIAAAQHRLRVYRAALEPGDGALCFGRIDAEDGDRWYIGRRHVEDADGEPVVVDWRAGVSVPFYRATYRDPQGLHLRRRFTVDGHTLTGIFDEDFTDPDGAHRASGVADPLLAELDRSRTGTMRDIVGTIQAEQDVVIRAPLDEMLLVQGGPGTGKTAVGLHRAALLLYDHRETLERDGVLVVGPNRRFLRYIAQVLPSLGEVAVVQTTVPGLGSVDVASEDNERVAELKGDPRLAEVIHRAAWGRVTPPTEDLVARTGWGTVRLPAGEVAGLVELCVAEERTVGAGRARFVAELYRAAHRQLLDRRSEGMQVSDAVAQEVRASAELRRALDRVWPATTGAALVRRLLTSRGFLQSAADGLLARDEQRALLRRVAAKGRPEPWTAADVPLVDEAEAVLGERPRRYGHLVVDEAQDLSAMALRMLARRCGRFPSLTVLGDLAQATAPAAQPSWEALARHLGAAEPVPVRTLTIGYRVPGQILDEANRLLPLTGTAVPASTSVRVTSRPLAYHHVEGDLVERAGEVARELGERHLSVAVIVPDGDPDLAARLATATAAQPDDEATVTVLVAPEAKGLEFDAVVVVEPARLAERGERGVRLLYVALTRAVQEVAVVHALPLPSGLGAP
jgi:DNA helicase IV